MREATADAHERLDRLYSRFDLSRASDYGAFLLAHAPAFVATERALTAAGAGQSVPGWGERLRADALLRDLAEMGLTPPEIAASPTFSEEADVLGGAYVLEGSRLGGALLIRSVAAGLPTAFLTPGNPADWRAFISVLDEKLSSPERLAKAISAADAVFALFEQYARAHMEPMSIAP